jgi:hypothetical protein
MRDIYRYGKDINSHDLLKILAIGAMVVDHVGRFFLDNDPWFRIVGRMAAAPFFFLVGYSGAYRFKPEILLYGVALTAIKYLTTPAETAVQHVDSLMPLNILISFTVIKAILNKFDPARLQAGSLILLLSILMSANLPTYLFIEYGTLGLCYAIGARLQRRCHRLRYAWICMTVAVHYCYEAVILLVLDASVPASILPFAAGLLAVLFSANLTIFLTYRLRSFEVKQRHLRTLTIYLSRYSLEVYFFHLSAFMLVSSL